MNSGKCPRCGKTAYAAESIKMKGDFYHKGCFKCSECDVRLTLNTFKVSDFGQREIFCAKCVPRVAPSQVAESVETERTKKANELTTSVRMVNDQVRGAQETLGKATHAVPT